MPIAEIPNHPSVSQILDKIALELVLAEPGKDNGLLPVNSLLAEIEDAVRACGWPVPVIEGVARGRDHVDSLLLAGCFEDASLTRIRGWVEWMQTALLAVSAGKPVPPPSDCPGPSAEQADPVANGSTTTSGEAEVAGDEDSIRLSLESDGDLLREFTNESHEHLQNIELGVLTLEENPTDSATLNSIFRAFHTFKGGSGFLNLRPINRLAHELESLLDLARQQELVIDSDVIEIILSGGDTLKQFVSAIESQLNGQRPGEPILISTRDLLRRVRAVIQGCKSPGAAAASPAPAPSKSAPAILPEAPGPVAVSVEARADLPLESIPETLPAPKSSDSVAPPRSSKAESPRAAATSPSAPAPSASGATAVKVDTQKLDSLVDLVGEMVIAQSMVIQDSDLLKLQSQQLTRNLAQLGRITKELQRVAMSLRMVPIRSTFQKMTRLVRDVSLKAGKQVELRMSGEDTELDRTIVEEISDPLVHMIRNAVDHGIETTEGRITAGKPAHGVIDLRAFHQGGNIVVEIEDDGAGIHRDRVLRKAIEKGIVPPDATLSESEIFALIFAPGFSTAEKVTDLSGRGVGMDVVRRNIEKLRGKVEIQSTTGKGSRFTIYLPLTLAIIDGMIVGIGQHRYIVPTLAVRESFRPTEGMVSSVQGRAEVVNVRGRLLPLVRLHSVFGIEARATTPTDGIVIVVESDRESRCLLVDDLLGKQEVVIKSLGDTFKQSSALAGAAILGDGRVGLILDVEGLVGSRTPALKAA